MPPGVQHHETVRLKAYPTREFGEIVWAYLGPEENAFRYSLIWNSALLNLPAAT